ncbi:hypothetical protein DFJ58DRAFT_848193 [Suillus subalutaceus]|uniref:uncharacterized protein n=1 Tax=Suillus subalutaceus TaxID=48586 RepID=UPI001B86A252|nr:uncharacterized protein DFJ58DRAFT_848193 [Suillus subalutaceus]KAG1831658.1 hypothetical protein DFJ58DRAFT_848193 [Suillus subalutaceus]
MYTAEALTVNVNVHVTSKFVRISTWQTDVSPNLIFSRLCVYPAFFAVPPLFETTTPCRPLVKLNKTKAHHWPPSTMTNTDSDNFVDIPSSFDSISDIPKDMTKTDSPALGRLFTFLCKFTLKCPDLGELWQEVRNETGWKKYNKHLHDEAQVLVVVVASLACMNQSRSQSLVLLSIMGLKFHTFFKTTATMVELDEDFTEDQRPFDVARVEVLTHLCSFRMIQFVLANSLGCLTGALSITALGVNGFTSFVVVATDRLDEDHRQRTPQHTFYSMIIEKWISPAEDIVEFVFSRMSSLCIQDGDMFDLEELWKDVRKENGWQKYNSDLKEGTLGPLVGHALVLSATLACRLNPPPAQELATISHGLYLWLLFASSLSSCMGLFFEGFFMGSVAQLRY